MALELKNYDPALMAGANIGIAIDLTDITDVDGNEVIEIDGTSSAVNYVRVSNSRTGVSPTLSGLGDDTTIALTLTAKGTAAVVINNDTDPVRIKVMGAADGYNNEIVDLSDNQIVRLQSVSSAVNELSLLNAATGSNPTITATGSDTNIGLQLAASGTSIVIMGNSSTATVVSGSCTINAQRGQITTDTLTAATASSETFHLLNTKLTSNCQIIASLGGGTNTTGLPILGVIKNSTAGSATFTIVNANSANDGAALDGNVKVNFVILS